MRSRKDYDAIRAIVRRVIATWNPYGLLSEGAPPDEFDEEVALVTARVPKIASPESAAAHLSDVFSQQFEPETFGVDACCEAGRDLYEQLRKAGYVGVPQ
jgi:hypothetical protein